MHFAQKRKNLETRARIFSVIRAYFAHEQFVEVDTNALQITYGGDAHISGFVTDYQLPHGGAQKLYLHSSPEFACKKLLSAGMERIYSLAHVFRNNEGSSRHHPEFMLLEWYRTGAGYVELMHDCMTLLRAALKAAGADVFSFGDKRCSADGFEVMSVQNAFLNFAKMDLLGTVDDPKKPSPQKLAARAKQAGIHVAEDDTWDDIVLRILGEKIEPHLGIGKPCFLTDYPLSMAALARQSPDEPRVAERFELYVCGIELANAYVELTDAKIQRERLVEAQQTKKTRHGGDLPIDEAFLKALETMPEVAGIALGVDRLVMLATGTQNIADVLWETVPGSV